MRLLPFIIFSLLQVCTLAQEKQLPDLLLATYGNMSDHSCGDDDFSQVVFFAIPRAYEQDFYIRVFDPDCGGLYDQSNGLWETNTVFEIFGGAGCISDSDARGLQPEGDYQSGTSLDKAIFARESVLDGKWYTFGPYETTQGEALEDYPGYVFFKVVVEGHTGNDGNIYGITVSKTSDANVPVQYVTQFGYETTIYGKEQSVVTVSANIPGRSGDENNTQISLPVELQELPERPSLEIIVEPIKE